VSKTLGGEDAFLIVDDTGLPKKGTESVGVAHQYFALPCKGASGFFDVWCLAGNFEFDQGIPPAAVRATFERRRTPEGGARSPGKTSRSTVPARLSLRRTLKKLVGPQPDVENAQAQLLAFRPGKGDTKYGRQTPWPS
jgi:hypothetical protein